jgi:hypothetical protein
MENKYKLTYTVDDVCKAALRAVGGYSSAQDPTALQMSEAREALNQIFDKIEHKLGFQGFLTDNRQRVFSEYSRVLQDLKYYRCINNYTAPTAANWVASTAYTEGAVVLNTSYDGNYYKARNAGTSHSSEPTYNSNQGANTTDNDIVWEAIPDEKPGVGNNWKSFWIEDTTETAVVYAYSIDYLRAGVFDLKEDEIEIMRAYIRYSGNDNKLTIVTELSHYEESLKSNQGVPEYLYLEQVGSDTTRCHIEPAPKLVGKDGYVLHYIALLRAENYTGTKTMSIPDHYFHFLKYELAYEISVEYDVSPEKYKLFEIKSHRAIKDINSRNTPRVSPEENKIAMDI